MLAWCLMVSRHPRRVSLVLIDKSAKLVVPSLRFSFSPCLRLSRARGAVSPRAPLTTLRSSLPSLHSSRLADLLVVYSSRVHALIPSLYSSCIRALSYSLLHFWISSLYAPSGKNRLVHFTIAACCFLPLSMTLSTSAKPVWYST